MHVLFHLQKLQFSKSLADFKQKQTLDLKLQTHLPGARAGVAREQHERAICVNEVRSRRGSVQRHRRRAPDTLDHTAFFLLLLLFCLIFTIIASQQVFYTLGQKKKKEQR